MESNAALDSLMYLPICAGLMGMVFGIFMAFASWKVHVKAGYPGWTSLVPFYNLYILTKIVGRPPWFLALFFIPLANVVAGIVVSLDLAKSFGKGLGFGILLFAFPLVGLPMLAFGDAEYVGPSVVS